MTIKAVVFDLGQVLIEWHPERFYDGVIGKARRQDFFAAVDIYAMNERIDLGANFRETVYSFADKTPEWRTEIRMWHDRWIEMASPAINGSVVVLNAVRAKGIPVFALTNFGTETLQEADKAYPFLSNFDQRFVSGELEMIKPDPRIYQALEQSCGFAGREILFTDDRPENIDAARERGWKTHLFKDPKGWAESLIANRVLEHGEVGKWSTL